jgi:hypothetical protein
MYGLFNSKNIWYMQLPNSSIIAANLPLLLTPNEIEAPEDLVAEFFETFDLDEIRRIIADVFLIALCAPKDELRGYSRSDISFTQTEMIRFVEAAFLLFKSSHGKSS